MGSGTGGLAFTEAHTLLMPCGISSYVTGDLSIIRGLLSGGE